MSRLVYDRQTGKVFNETSYAEKGLNFLYGNLIGRILLKTIYARPWYSRAKAIHYNSTLSARKTTKFINKYVVDINQFEDRPYHTFNDFFTRKFKSGARSVDPNPQNLIAVADSRLLALDINQDSQIDIKQSKYTISELLGGDDLADDYADGICLVFRLALEDCHRYFHFDSGRVKRTNQIKGLLHAVRPLPGKITRAYAENSREYSELVTDNFGPVVMIEVGAMEVGKIYNHPKKGFNRGQEKGYFGLGGSTCVLLLKKGAAVIDKDIVKNSLKGVETKVRMGERIGTANV
ncbi:MAG: phosphatidylserine decarboxylase [Candidatus Saccharimonadales bacterium]|nr:phosphatidylserine decarboxylase [Candidatus Saccharimonadales bacterium]